MVQRRGCSTMTAPCRLTAAGSRQRSRRRRSTWSEIDPSILGTLFERGLDPDKRSQLGAHYTDRDKIMRLIEPVIVRPLLAEWEKEKAAIAVALERAETVRSEGGANPATPAGGRPDACLPRTVAAVHSS